MQARVERPLGRSTQSERHAISVSFALVPVVGLEPTRGISPTDFESVTSTNSITPADVSEVIIHEAAALGKLFLCLGLARQSHGSGAKPKFSPEMQKMPALSLATAVGEWYDTLD